MLLQELEQRKQLSFENMANEHVDQLKHDEEHVIRNAQDKLAAEKRLIQLETNVEDNFLNEYFRNGGGKSGNTVGQFSLAPSAHTINDRHVQPGLSSDGEDKPEFLKHPETTENQAEETEEDGQGKTNMGAFEINSN